MIFNAILFRTLRFLAPFFSNVVLSSSLKTISNGACKLFSIPQCFLTASANIFISFSKLIIKNLSSIVFLSLFRDSIVFFS